MSQSLAEIMHAHSSSLNRTRASSSIEQLQLNKETKNNNSSIELPVEIDDLIDNKMYRNRYKRLMREGYKAELLYIARYATMLFNEGKMQPGKKASFQFAKMCSLARWEGTLRWVKHQFEIIKKATQVAEKLGIPITKFIYQQIRRGINVMRWADEAKDIGRDKAKYFAWLCKRESQTCC